MPQPVISTAFSHYIDSIDNSGPYKDFENRICMKKTLRQNFFTCRCTCITKADSKDGKKAAELYTEHLKA